MSHISPGAYLVWTLLTFFLLTFLIYHLWAFDRFRSLRWNSRSGTFKPVMIYAYLWSIPVLFLSMLGFTIIKYHEGYIELPFGTTPTPYTLWEPFERKAIFPLMLLFSLGWSLEMVTHLEELCFWLFLINATYIERNWFRSPYFKVWVGGSIVAVLYMPLVSVFTRSDPLMNEAYTFLSGSLGSLAITIWFLPILHKFPSFLMDLRSEGIDIKTIVRLTRFSELNSIRVAFRFLFTVPVVILGIDGVRPHKHINDNLFATDFLVMLAGFGCVVSSAITLIIFFPRSIEGEIDACDARNGISTGANGVESQIQMSSRIEPLVADSYPSPTKGDFNMRSASSEGHKYEGPEYPPLRPNRRNEHTELGSQRPTNNTFRVGNVNPMVINYTSPIDIADYSNTSTEARLTFTRR